MKLPEGWAKPLEARRFHYFRGGRSLCGTWEYYSKDKGDYDTAVKNSPADCDACHRKLKGEEKK